MLNMFTMLLQLTFCQIIFFIAEAPSNPLLNLPFNVCYDHINAQYGSIIMHTRTIA